MPPIKAILFDLDGTLIDSVTDLANSVNYTLAKISLPVHTIDEIRGFVGDGVQNLIKRSLGPSNMDKFHDALTIFMTHYGEHCTDSTVLYPGVAETLRVLSQHYTLGVLTNKSLKFTVKILHTLGINSYFTEILGGDSLATKKPDPEGIFLLAGKWGLDPEREVIMVGDHATDIEVGQRAGCKTVFLAGTIGEKRNLVPDFVMESITELPALLKKL